MTKKHEVIQQIAQIIKDHFNNYENDTTGEKHLHDAYRQYYGDIKFLALMNKVYNKPKQVKTFGSFGNLNLLRNY